MLTILGSAVISSPIVVNPPDYTGQLTQALAHLEQLIAEVQNHAAQSNLDASEIIKASKIIEQLTVFQSAVTGTLNILANDVGVIKVSQDQIREIITRIGGYLPEIQTQLTEFKSATLLSLETLGASVVTAVIDEGNQTQDILNNILTAMQPKERYIVTKSFRIDLGPSDKWTRLVVPKGAIKFFLVPLESLVEPIRQRKQYFFENTIRESYEAISRDILGSIGNELLVYGEQIIEFPPNSLWDCTYAATKELELVFSEVGGSGIPANLNMTEIEIPSELATSTPIQP